MQPPANPHNEINKSAATLLAAATQAAMLLVQQRRKTLQDAGKHSQQTAHRIQKLQDQQLQAAKPIFKQAHQPGFWNQDLDSIADTYQTCKTWELWCVKVFGQFGYATWVTCVVCCSHACAGVWYPSAEWGRIRL